MADVLRSTVGAREAVAGPGLRRRKQSAGTILWDDTMEATQEHGQRPLLKAPHLLVFGASTGTLLPTSRQLTRP